MERHLRRCGLLRASEAEPGVEGDPEGNLAASAVSGQAPPAGPQWVSCVAPLEPHGLAYDKPLCASLDGFLARGDAGGRSRPGGPGGAAALRAASSGCAGARGAAWRWPGAHHALVRIMLKKAYADGTIAVDMDPLSLL